MTTKKHALLIFSKPPIPGMVKTRLTRERGGILSEQQAAEFFRRSLYDVSEQCMHALIELQRENDARLADDPDAAAVTYDFYVSTTPADNVQAMRETYDAIGPWPMEVHYLTDAGATFDDHFDDAFAGGDLRFHRPQDAAGQARRQTRKPRRRVDHAVHREEGRGRVAGHVLESWRA